MVTIIYRPDSEQERSVLDFQRELVRAQVITRLVNVDSREGSEMARIYDIVKYPGVLITTEDGQLLKSWDGELPQISEATATAHS